MRSSEFLVYFKLMFEDRLLSLLEGFTIMPLNFFFLPLLPINILWEGKQKVLIAKSLSFVVQAENIFHFYDLNNLYRHELSDVLVKKEKHFSNLIKTVDFINFIRIQAFPIP